MDVVVRLALTVLSVIFVGFIPFVVPRMRGEAMLALLPLVFLLSPLI